MTPTRQLWRAGGPKQPQTTQMNPPHTHLRHNPLIRHIALVCHERDDHFVATLLPHLLATNEWGKEKGFRL